MRSVRRPSLASSASSGRHKLSSAPLSATGSVLYLHSWSLLPQERPAGPASASELRLAGGALLVTTAGCGPDSVARRGAPLKVCESGSGGAGWSPTGTNSCASLRSSRR
eukprot:1182074-Prorocentrum_minimum.AAC.6